MFTEKKNLLKNHHQTNHLNTLKVFVNKDDFLLTEDQKKVKEEKLQNLLKAEGKILFLHYLRGFPNTRV